MKLYRFYLYSFFVVFLWVTTSCNLLNNDHRIERIEELEGRYVLTDQNDIHIFHIQNEWRFQIGNNNVYAIEPDGKNQWKVTDLDIEINGIKVNDAIKLQLKRYNETIILSSKEDEVILVPEELSASEIIELLTPRLMIYLNVPGVSVSLIEKGEIVWLGQFGIKTYGQTEIVTDETIFEAASMSKPLFSYVVLQLVEEGVLDLDIPLVEYMGKSYIENEPLHEKITARMVMSHTSGLPNWRSGGLMSGSSLNVNFEPGSSFQYSGEGFYFLQQVVESLTGIPTEELIQTRLLRPLGMHSSSFVWQSAYDSLGSAGHNEQGHIPEHERRIYHAANTAYSLYTTPSEYAQLLIEIMKNDRSASHSLSSEMISEMLSIQSDAIDRIPIERIKDYQGVTVHYGLGWRIETWNTSTSIRICHSGSNGTGFRCYSEFNPKTETGIVIMTNATGGRDLWKGVMRFVAK